MKWLLFFDKYCTSRCNLWSPIPFFAKLNALVLFIMFFFALDDLRWCESIWWLVLINLVELLFCIFLFCMIFVGLVAHYYFFIHNDYLFYFCCKTLNTIGHSIVWLIALFSCNNTWLLFLDIGNLDNAPTAILLLPRINLICNPNSSSIHVCRSTLWLWLEFCYVKFMWSVCTSIRCPYRIVRNFWRVLTSSSIVVQLCWHLFSIRKKGILGVSVAISLLLFVSHSHLCE